MRSAKPKRLSKPSNSYSPISPVRSCLLITLLLLLPAQPTQRATLQGIVTDAETGAPLADVNVFLAGTTLGTATDTTGHFRLARVPPGAYQLYASRLGYEAAVIDTLLQADRSYTLALRLEPAPYRLDEVTIRAERDEAWLERLNKFERHFLGESARAEQTAILNAEVLDFETRWWGKLAAHAKQTLVTENQALGYRLRYVLKDFTTSGRTTKWDGDPLFEPLAPTDSAQAMQWAQNRRRAYRGSLRHFLRALLADRVREEGFRVEYAPPQMGASNARVRLNPRTFLSRSADSTLHVLDFSGRLLITYLHEPETRRYLDWLGDRGPPDRHQQSQLELNDGVVTVDPAGEIVEPYGATQYGYFAFERVADRLPKAYRPGE